MADAEVVRLTRVRTCEAWGKSRRDWLQLMLGRTQDISHLKIAWPVAVPLAVNATSALLLACTLLCNAV
eukprot:6208025-Pleurochrysis_carterae.AAC.1